MEDQQSQEVPPLSIVEDSRLCCCPTKHIRKINAHFCGEWEVDLFMPIFVIFLIIASYVSYVISMPSEYSKTTFWYILFPIFTFLFIMFLVSYINTIRTGPGYYPYYYSVRDKVRGNEGDALLGPECPLSGVISTNEQYTFAHEGTMPPRSILSKSARRIVMKPDHLCGWTATWIGKRNFKLFILFNVYGFLYTGFFCGTAWKVAAVLLTDINNFGFARLMVLILMLFAINFFFFTLSFAWTSLCNACKNRTSWEEWNKISPETFDKGCCNNMKDTCDENVCTWMCPCAPFKGKSNDELMSQYVVYPRNHRFDN